MINIEVRKVVIADKVRTQYEAFPYPHYPLLAPLRWQDGYLTSANLARTLATPSDQRAPAAVRDVLLAGCGEVLPYIVRKWEPMQRSLHCVDLSTRSLRRARIRLTATPGRTEFHATDLNEYIRQLSPGRLFDHIDSFGVLHHLADPAKTLQHLSARLRGGGTMRIMVYNSPARRWIREIQRALLQIGLSPYRKQDRDDTRRLLAALAKASPRIGQRLQAVGTQTLKNDARLVDTFMHPHEVFWRIERWFAAIEAAGLQVVGLVDRYAELDDLPNPLWHPPRALDLAERAAQGSFSGNLELYLRQHGEAPSSLSTESSYEHGSPWALWQNRRSPPSLWRQFSEIKTLSQGSLRKIWQWHLLYVHARRAPSAGFEAFLRTLPRASVQRLARLGAIVHGQIESQELRASLMAAMEETTEAMFTPPAVENLDRNSELLALVRELLENRQRLSNRRLDVVMQRFRRSEW